MRAGVNPAATLRQFVALSEFHRGASEEAQPAALAFMVGVLLLTTVETLFRRETSRPGKNGVDNVVRGRFRRLCHDLRIDQVARKTTASVLQ